MRRVVTLVALALAAGSAAEPQAAQRRGVIVFAGGPAGREELFTVTIGRPGARRLTRNTSSDVDPAWSPDGTRIAFAHRGAIALVNADGTGFRRLTARERDAQPTWSPRGARLAFARSVASSTTIRWIEVRGGREGRFAWSRGAERDPAWSPDGRSLAFAALVDGNWEVFVAPARGGAPQRLTTSPGEDRHPAWSPDGRQLAFASNRAGTFDIYAMRADGTGVRQLTAGATHETAPRWSPDATRVAYSDAGVLHVVRTDGTGIARVPAGRHAHGSLDWRLVPSATELLPDLDQRAPRGLVVTTIRGRFKLGFVSATDNVGRGAVRIRGVRPSRRMRTMTAHQLISLAGGGIRVEREVGLLRYSWSSSHSHWHLLGFQTYELRRAGDFRVVVRDRKSGFCLADHYGFAARRVQGFRRPRFLSNCGGGRPDLLSVNEGTSIGYTDRYPAHFHGQNLDVTRVPAGRYVLVHRSNPRALLRERRYDNNAASAAIRIAWPRGRRAAPQVTVLAVCEGTERCGR